MNDPQNRFYHVTRAREDVLDIPCTPIVSQRAIYGLGEPNFPFDAQIPDERARTRRPDASQQTFEHNARDLLKKSFSNLKTKVADEYHHFRKAANEVKDRSIRRGEGASEFLRENPNVAIGLEVMSKAAETFVSVMNTLNAKMEDAVNRMSRPKWEFKPGYQPYCQRSFDAGNYEYEVMIFRRRLNCVDKIAAQCNVPNVFR